MTWLRLRAIKPINSALHVTVPGACGFGVRVGFGVGCEACGRNARGEAEKLWGDGVPWGLDRGCAGSDGLSRSLNVTHSAASLVRARIPRGIVDVCALRLRPDLATPSKLHIEY
jgi:hypothetical protein